MFSMLIDWPPALALATLPQKAGRERHVQQTGFRARRGAGRGRARRRIAGASTDSTHTGRSPRGDAPPAFVMIAHIQFASPEALQAALDSPRMAELRADLANFTDIRPTILLGRSE
jgi:hypothetical protein